MELLEKSTGVILESSIPSGPFHSRKWGRSTKAIPTFGLAIWVALSPLKASQAREALAIQSPSVTEILNELEREPNAPVASTPAAAMAGAVGGAVAAAVEYAWDRYVGNGPKERGKSIDLSRFDLVSPSKTLALMDTLERELSPAELARLLGVKNVALLRLYTQLNENELEREIGNPEASTPAVVAGAAAGAVAHKAVEYAFRTMFGAHAPLPDLPAENAFDLKQ